MQPMSFSSFKNTTRSSSKTFATFFDHLVNWQEILHPAEINFRCCNFGYENFPFDTL